MGDLMTYGMFIGGVGGAMKNNSNSSINDACKEFAQVNEEFEHTLNQWEDTLGKESMIKFQLDSTIQSLTSSKHLYDSALRSTKDAFRETELITMITIGLFIFSIILTFLFRYFNVYSNIWNYFVKKK